jgi:hypothetical protein
MTGVFWAGSLDGKSIEDHRTTFAEISAADGLSQTVLLTENVHAGFQANAGRAAAADPKITYDDFTWAYPDVAAVGFGISTEDICGDGRLNCAEPYTSLARSSINGDLLSKGGDSPFHPSSFHTDVIVVGFCDGRVQTLSEKIEPKVWFSLVTPQGTKLPLEPERSIFLRQGLVGDNDY